ncbi:molecular chaperone [Bradyrhizobium sp. KBS0727]|uniref:fimbrial biogenesis chaperone n=1 Tax=unclassified Bradyrhizobium TaxID=2631580 RepID=UPI00110E040B|nr:MULTISPECIES: molecular chaperone [unclassified Bradyrhizobium]QDW36460.1 molecular chaperone [Bradyrhizobium sp. KBS0725]QDW43059.1 molecular chaperone [Bradyrhizobium sp. KBS0727]
MTVRSALLWVIVGVCVSPWPALAAQLQVEPVLLELSAPTAAGVLTLRNNDDVEAVVQTRVVRWSQSNGSDVLEPATDVVASPPSVTLAPHSDYVVRVVRVSKQPVREEESYRVIVDQLPTTLAQQNRSVNVLIRQSIPVFFRIRNLRPASVSWTVRREVKKLVLTASNAGSEHLRLASLRLRNSAGMTISYGNGLAGYVLGQSTKSWILPDRPAGFEIKGSISIAAESDKGPVSAIARSSDGPQ